MTALVKHLGLILLDHSRFSLCYTRYHKITSILHNLTLQEYPGSEEDLGMEGLGMEGLGMEGLADLRLIFWCKFYYGRHKIFKDQVRILS